MDSSNSQKVAEDESEADRWLTALRAIPKTPLTRKGMSPQDLLKFAGTVSEETLDDIEQAINEGCGRVETHGR